MALVNAKNKSRVIIVSGILALVVIFFVIAVVSSDTSPTRPVSEVVEKVSPPPGGLHRPSAEITVDLKDGFTGRLYIDGVVVPEDQLETVAALGQLSFYPGPGKIIEAFETGTHSARVTFWPADEKEPASPEEFSWDFRVTS